MPYRPDDTAFDTDDMAPRAAATPQEMFYALTAQGVPRQQAMVAAYSRDNDMMQATLQAYGRPARDLSIPEAGATRAIPNAPLSSLTEIPVVDTRLAPAEFSRGQVVQPLAARGTSVFPDPPQFPPQTIDDTMRRRPGLIPRPDGGENVGPGYLDPRSETQRRSPWAARDSSRESLGLPQDSTGQFAGVNLTGDAGSGYGLDPHYAAQTRRALETEPHVPSERERIVRGGKFYAGAAPFGFAGPGSLSFDPSLESNTQTLAPFRRSLEDFQTAHPVPVIPRAGNYVGAVKGSRFGLGGGAYVDDSGHIYPQIYLGTPGASASAGHSDNLDSQLTGLSATGSLNKVNGRRIPGAGILYGFGPYEMPRLAKFIQEHLL